VCPQGERVRRMSGSGTIGHERWRDTGRSVGARSGSEARRAGANGWAGGGLDLEVGDGPDKWDLAVGEVDMEEGVGPTQEKKRPRGGAG
jgi:hypothetical protein